MEKYLCLILFFLCKFHFVNAQKDTSNIYSNEQASGYYANLDSAIKNSEKVYYLDLTHIDASQLLLDLYKFKNLERLQIYSCDIESIPDNIGELKNLEWIDLSFNNLKTLPSTVGMLEKLKFLDLSHNKIVQLPDFIYELKGLETLSLSENSINFIERRKIRRKFKGRDISIVFKERKKRKKHAFEDSSKYK